ncbi:MAG: tetratricopeptide repeat protein [Blastocatellia bacterium]
MLKPGSAGAMIEAEGVSPMGFRGSSKWSVIGRRLANTWIIPIFLLSTLALAQSSRSNDDTKQNAAAAFEEGQSAQQRGELNLAVKHYTNAISADPSLFQAHYQRATAFIALGREADAEADLKRVIELDQNFARAHRALGQLLLDRGITEDAQRELARAIDLDPALPGVRILYASALIKSGQPARALEHLQVAIARGEDVALCYALLGVVHERLGKSEDAFAAYSRAIELDPANATAREGRGRGFEKRGEFSKAIEDLSAAYRSQPSSDLALALAQVHTRAGQLQAAIQLYRGLIRDKPEELALRAEMARLMYENGQTEEAAREITAVVTARPRDSKLLAIAGDIYFKDKPDAAATFYRRALEANANDNHVRAQLGASLVRSMQYQEALPILSAAIAREAGNYAAHASLATALFKLKQYPEAAREFVWLIRTRPEIAASYYFLANSFEHLGDCEQALRCYQEYVRRADPVVNESEVDEAKLRVAQLQRLAKEGKCKSPSKSRAR